MKNDYAPCSQTHLHLLSPRIRYVGIQCTERFSAFLQSLAYNSNRNHTVCLRLICTHELVGSCAILHQNLLHFMYSSCAKQWKWQDVLNFKTERIKLLQKIATTSLYLAIFVSRQVFESFAGRQRYFSFSLFFTVRSLNI